MDVNEQDRESLNRLEQLVKENVNRADTLLALHRFTHYLETLEIPHLSPDDTAAGTRTAVGQLAQIVEQFNKQLLSIVVTEEEFDQEVQPMLDRYRNALQRFNQMTGKIITGLEQFEQIQSGPKN